MSDGPYSPGSLSMPDMSTSSAASMGGGGLGSFLGGVGLEAAGSLLSSGLNMYQANKQMKWQERMSNTAWQRQVADMRAAGINPMLAVSKGSGASTPQGASGQTSNPFSSGVDAVTAYQQNKLAREQQENNNTVALATASKMNAEESHINYQKDLTKKEIDSYEIGNLLKRAQAASSMASAYQAYKVGDAAEAAKGKDAALLPVWKEVGDILREGIKFLGGGEVDGKPSVPGTNSAKDVHTGGKFGKRGTSGGW